jgi:cbb3-type cytochrome oxidase subunit 3
MSIEMLRLVIAIFLALVFLAIIIWLDNRAARKKSATTREP